MPSANLVKGHRQRPWTVQLWGPASRRMLQRGQDELVIITHGSCPVTDSTQAVSETPPRVGRKSRRQQPFNTEIFHTINKHLVTVTKHQLLQLQLQQKCPRYHSNAVSSTGGPRVQFFPAYEATLQNDKWLFTVYQNSNSYRLPYSALTHNTTKPETPHVITTFWVQRLRFWWHNILFLKTIKIQPM